ncbi:MAG: anti-sigma factor family protein [Planctomycetota bacterium]|jgi:hypothetical protein
MNCQDCKEHLIEYIEELLEGQQKEAVALHLADCPNCRAEAVRMTDLRKRLLQNGQTFAETDLEGAVFDRIVRSQHLKIKEIRKTNRQFNLWRIIMKSRITKFATAAAVIIIAVLGITFLEESTPTAYAIEQTIHAYNTIRFLYVKEFKANHDEPLEFWIKSDDQGGIEKARYYLPEHVSPEDGSKLITWSPAKAELFFKRKNSYLIFQSKRIEGMMQYFLQQSQPKLVMEKLLEDQEAGIVDIDIQRPQEKHKPVAITVTDKAKPRKTIYYINQATDLITFVDIYEIKDNRDVLLSTTEYYDYNVPIDEKMFSIADEVPEDVTKVDWLNQLIGIPQADMTDEQAAIETVRQFFQALADHDYTKAGLIFSGVSADKVKEYFGQLNVTKVISVGPTTPYPLCGEHSFSVSCEVELTAPDGQNRSRKFGSVKARCGDDEMHPDRWIIHGGI